jgi:hypothetical protein
MPSRSAGRTPEAESDFWSKVRKDKDLGADWITLIESR